jgi:hypothetical protein
MTRKRSSENDALNTRAQGAAFIAWCKETKDMEGFTGGMISRAQAARVLGISQVGINRLIGRGFIRARHFPKEPDVEQVPVCDDDPFWHRLIGKIATAGGDTKEFAWYQACYVSLDDVLKLWEQGNQQEVSKMNWKVFLPGNDHKALCEGPHASKVKSRRRRNQGANQDQ